MLRALPVVRPNFLHWQAIVDQKVREAESESQVKLARLGEEHGELTLRRRQVAGELVRMGVPEAQLQAHRTAARWWGGLFAFAVVVTILGAWWSLSWYLSLTWEKALLALSLFVLPLIGWMAFLAVAQERAKRFWWVIASMALAVVLCSLIATILLGAVRMAATALEEERAAARLEASDDLAAETHSPKPQAVARVKGLLDNGGMFAVILLGIAGELGAGLAFHEYFRRWTVIRTVAPFYREERDLAELVIVNVHQQEEARRWPEILRARLVRDGLEREAAEAQAAAAEVAEAKRAAEAEERRYSFGRLVFWVVGTLLLSILLLAAYVGYASAEALATTTVVVLDVSASTPEPEFSANLRAVEGIVQRLTPGSRLVVLAISEGGFGAMPLLSETAPLSPGRFGEHLAAWQESVRKKWRDRVANLKPAARGSDIFGALGRAAVEFDGAPEGSRRLVVLSDMRHVGRGFDFERPLGDPLILIERTERQGLVPKFVGVRVWLLGVHTGGLDERQWARLRVFWEEYFRRAGAELQAFGPNRRLAGG